MKKVIQFIKYFIDKIKENHTSMHAAGCAYYTILAFIPMIMLILTLIRYIGIDEEILFWIFNEVIPSNLLSDAVMGIVREVHSKSVGTITVSAVFILWSAGKGFFALCKGLNDAYGVKDEIKFVKFRIRAIISTLIFILSVVLTLILLVFGNSINQVLQEKFNVFSKIINFILKSKFLISIVLLSIIFMFIYKFIPKHKSKFKYQLPGALLAAIACNVISAFYAIYIDVFTGFSLMYGSLTTIALAMIWVYWCMYSILLGATINKIIIEIIEERKMKR